YHCDRPLPRTDPNWDPEFRRCGKPLHGLAIGYQGYRHCFECVPASVQRDIRRGIESGRLTFTLAPQGAPQKALAAGYFDEVLEDGTRVRPEPGSKIDPRERRSDQIRTF